MQIELNWRPEVSEKVANETRVLCRRGQRIGNSRELHLNTVAVWWKAGLIEDRRNELGCGSRKWNGDLYEEEGYGSESGAWIRLLFENFAQNMGPAKQHIPTTFGAKCRYSTKNEWRGLHARRLLFNIDRPFPTNCFLVLCWKCYGTGLGTDAQQIVFWFDAKMLIKMQLANRLRKWNGLKVLKEMSFVISWFWAKFGKDLFLRFGNLNFLKTVENKLKT